MEATQDQADISEVKAKIITKINVEGVIRSIDEFTGKAKPHERAGTNRN